MTRDDLSEFLNQDQEDGWDLDNLIHETMGKIGKYFFPSILDEVEFMDTKERWKTYIYNLLAFLVADADDILAAHHFAQQKKEILQIAVDQEETQC